MSKDASQIEHLDALELSWGASAIPTEISLFGSGMTETKKGSFLFDEESAAMVMAAFADSGVDRLPFDAGHGMLQPNAHPEAHKALGWFVPAVKQDFDNGGQMALFASDIQWTDAGQEALEKREFRFFSPAITFDPETRRIRSLINVALTNIPATKGQKPLVLDGTSETQETPKKDLKMQVVLDALGASDEAGAVAKIAELSKASEQFQAELSAAKDELIEAKADLAKVEAAREADAKASKIEALSAVGKLPPAQKAFAESLSLEQLEKFSASLSDVVSSAPVVEPEGAPVEALSDEEKKVIKLLGVTEAAYRAQKEGK